MRSTPLDDERMAYQVAALPQEYGRIRINQLFTRGYERWTVDGKQQSEKLIADVEQFGTAAFSERVRQEALDQPFVDEPGTLAVLTTLGAFCVMAHPKIEQTSPSKVQLLHDIRELYVNTITSLVREYGDRTLLKDIAEVLYAKPVGADGPHPGRVCTGIEEKLAFGGGYYIEIPMAAASRACLVQAGSRGGTDAASETSANGDGGKLLTRVEDNHLYVPIGDFDDKYRQRARRGFETLLDVQRRGLTDDQLRWLTTHEEAITDRIDRFLTAGQYARVWTDWNAGDRAIRALTKAVRAASDEVCLGEFHTASELYAAVNAYDPDDVWTQQVLATIASSMSLAKTLQEHGDHPKVSIRSEERVSKYRLAAHGGRSRPITVDSIEALFELPCMANMDDRLQQEQPVRKDLYNFVRMAMWLPQYRDSDLDTLVRDIKAVFSRWPWYDEAITDYQVRYEFDNDIKGKTPLPMNCDNDDMQRYCIGQERCPYSIWGSLPFPEEMYEQADDGADSEIEF